MNRFQFVADHQRRYGVKRLCTILDIVRSSFYYWRRTAADRAARQAADAGLAARIRAVHRESDGTYGVLRITAELREDGERVNHKRVARVMRSINLAGLRLRREHRTTTPDPAAAKAPDLIGRDFTARETNTKYVGDTTYLPLEKGKLIYLATVIALASRRLTGCGARCGWWAASSRIRLRPRRRAMRRALPRSFVVEPGFLHPAGHCGLVPLDCRRAGTWAHRIARKGTETSQRLGRHRWTIERTMSWLAGCRRLHRRYERKAEHFLAFTSIACTLICYRRLVC
ncbi:IS3 family transposase [Streptomyces sp. PAM3C]|nr:IS3 family transposase [Streptomyces sp. PAM3C]